MSAYSNTKLKKILELNLRPPIRNVPFPDIGKPQPVGFYSINADRDFEANDHQLKYLKLPKKFPLDLNAGLEMAIQKPNTQHEETLGSLLKFINDHFERIFNHGNTTALPEFIVWQGILRLIMCAPYEQIQDLCLHVTRFNNTFYMIRRNRVDDLYNRWQPNIKGRKSTDYIFNFQQYCLTKSPSRDPDTSIPFNKREEFCFAIQTRLAGINILYGAEVDGIISDTPIQLNYKRPSNLDSLKSVKLKVRQSNASDSRRNRIFLHHTIRKWWCQSFLVGIKDLYVGIRNEEGLVDKIEHMDVRSLPNLQSQKYWRPSVCTNFLLEFLLQLRVIMANENCPHTVYEFYFDPKTRHITYECFRGRTSHSFIPDWYICKFDK